MSDWQDKSDLEINIAVTMLEFNCDGWEFNGVNFYHCGADGSGYFSQSVIDYCNSPSDAGAIILDNKINLVAPNAGVHWRVFVNIKDMGVITGYCSSYDKNPLRAAMIVYLEMNGVKPNE